MVCIGSGICSKCKKPTTLMNGLCYPCRAKIKRKEEKELIALGKKTLVVRVARLEEKIQALEKRIPMRF